MEKSENEDDLENSEDEDELVLAPVGLKRSESNRDGNVPRLSSSK